MTTIPISPEALESIKRMTVKLTEDNNALLKTLKHFVRWHDQINVVDLDKAKKLIAKVEAQPAVMEKP